MTKPVKIVAGLLASLAVLLILVGVTAILILRTERFNNYARSRVISAIETNTGGRAEFETFTLDLAHLRAEITGFILHGTEPAGNPPLFQARRIVVTLKLLGSLRPSKMFDLDSLRVDQP